MDEKKLGGKEIKKSSRKTDDAEESVDFENMSTTEIIRYFRDHRR